MWNAVIVSSNNEFEDDDDDDDDDDNRTATTCWLCALGAGAVPSTPARGRSPARGAASAPSPVEPART